MTVITRLLLCFILFLVKADNVMSADFKIPDNLGPSNFNFELIDAFTSSGQEGIMAAFKGNPHMGGTEIQASYYLNENLPFTGEYMIGNYTKNKIKLNILCLLNYRQQEFSLNNKNGVVHKVELEPGERETYLLNINVPGKGAYDFLLLVIKSYDLDDPFGQIIDPIYHRANIFSGSTKFPNIKYRPIGNTPSFANQTFRLSLGKSNDPGENPRKKQPISKSSYYLNINNNMNSALPSGLVAFVDYKQVRFYNGEFNLFLEVLSNKRDALLLDMKDYFHLGENELFILSIDNPYNNLEIRGKNNQINPIFTEVRATNRLIHSAPKEGHFQ